MEDWEFELEFLTYDVYEKAISNQGSVEEFEIEQDTFEEQLKEFNSQYDSNNNDDWELIDNG